MFTLLKNTNLYSPKFLGKKDILIVNDKIVAIDDNLDQYKNEKIKIYDAKGKIVTPGFIDQHIHVIGAGGKQGYASMTPEVTISELIACGSTTINSLLGTDGTVRDLRFLYAKVKALEQEGISATMFCGYYGLDTPTITDTIQADLIFIDKIIGCKIAISDIRSSYPTARDLLNILRQVRNGGFIGRKKGIMHVHLGNLETKMDILFELVHKYQFPIAHISPTHVGRTKALFDQAIEFAKLGGMIDITTGASQYEPPYKSVLYAIEQGVSIDNMTFSTDGHAGLTKFDEDGNSVGSRVAPIHKNLEELQLLINKGNYPIAQALKLVTTNPAKNLGLKYKGKVDLGYDADFCFFDKDFNLTDVFAKGKLMMEDKKITVKGTFED